MIFNMVYGETWVPKEVDILNDTSITGGWSGSLNHIYCAEGDGGTVVPVVYTNNKVDVSKYNKITFTVSDISWGGCYAFFCVSTSNSVNNAVVSKDTGGFQQTYGEVVLDVSGLSGEYYLIVNLRPYYQNGGYLTVSNIVMSK